MNTISATNPQWLDAAHTKMQLTVHFDTIGVVPFGASSTATEQHEIDLFNNAVAGAYGAIAEYAAPTATPAPVVVSAFQIRLALNQIGMRAAVETAVAAGSPDLRDAWEYATSYSSDDQLVRQIAAAMGQTPAQLLAVFEVAKNITI
jgi:hypothetical protein